MSHEWYIIKKPAELSGRGKRKSFTIQAQCRINGRLRTRALSLPELDVINKSLHEGRITLGAAEKEVLALKESLYKKRDGVKPEILFSEENAKVLSAYWEENYTDRDLVDPESMHYDLKRSIAYLRGLSLHTASQKDMQTEINNTLSDNPNLQRRIVTRLNQLLAYVGRNFKLKKLREQKNEVKFLSLDEFKQLMLTVKDPFERALYWTAFGTGARLGECFALSLTHIVGRHVKITRQMDKEKTFRPTKTNNIRSAWIHPDAISFVKEWAELPEHTKKQYRSIQFSKRLATLSGKLFESESKTIVFHDLRHSYAVMLLQKGTPLNLVAQSLGNSSAVCEKYYTGFVISDVGLETIERIMTKT
jgi:integrase